MNSLKFKRCCVIFFGYNVIYVTDCIAMCGFYLPITRPLGARKVVRLLRCDFKISIKCIKIQCYCNVFLAPITIVKGVSTQSKPTIKPSIKPLNNIAMIN